VIQAHASASQKLKAPVKDEKYSRIITDDPDYDKAIASEPGEGLNEFSPRVRYIKKLFRGENESLPYMQTHI
jgi:hypothetical protein